ncbi:MAG: NYN domain-containing protein [Planctomycetaceae bacterium]|jgi:uncharacterized LabA/DUF88 family protein|nr:NYN domain-containing protein [Planctomycetaceae bacterium]
MKRVITFIDGQNLFYAAKRAFDYNYPNYDPVLLSRKVCSKDTDWQLIQTRFYTGVPSKDNDPKRHRFWQNKKGQLMRLYQKEIVVHTPHLVQHNGSYKEKGIDVKIAIDIVHLAMTNEYDIAVLFSQDRDFNEIGNVIAKISKNQNRKIELFCAFPVSALLQNNRGVKSMLPIMINKQTYDSAIDFTDYR